ncbi:C-type lysozyme, inhibitor, partial [Halomonas sp. BBD48]|nr:C-type lysozyme, inhibitor [Halomonas sp. BBD48]
MRLIPLYAAMLMVAGCASQAPAPSAPPDIQDLNHASTEQAPVEQADTAEAKPTSPLLPSAFFADGAPAFVAWRCTPAQDLIAASPEGELRLWSRQGFYRLDPAVVASGARYVKGD